MIDILLLKKNIIPFLVGAKASLCIAFFSFLIGLLIGSVLAFFLLSKNVLLQSIGLIYITIIRGTPMLLHIMLLFLFLPLIGFILPVQMVAILAIGLNSAAYMSQVIKTGIESVSSGQQEAARSLGLTRFQTFLFIIFPQGLKTIFPMLKNEAVTLIKDSSLASVIGVFEISQQGQLIASSTYDALTAYVGVGIAYLLLTFLVSFFFYLIERRFFYA